MSVREIILTFPLVTSTFGCLGKKKYNESWQEKYVRKIQTVKVSYPHEFYHIYRNKIHTVSSLCI